MYTASRIVQDTNGAPRIVVVVENMISPAKKATVKGADAKKTQNAA